MIRSIEVCAAAATVSGLSPERIRAWMSRGRRTLSISHISNTEGGRRAPTVLQAGTRSGADTRWASHPTRTPTAAIPTGTQYDADAPSGVHHDTDERRPRSDARDEAGGDRRDALVEPVLRHQASRSRRWRR